MDFNNYFILSNHFGACDFPSFRWLKPLLGHQKVEGKTLMSLCLILYQYQKTLTIEDHILMLFICDNALYQASVILSGIYCLNVCLAHRPSAAVLA